MYVNLKKIKDHLNIDQDFYEDDKYLRHLEEACECAVSNHILKNLDDIVTDCGDLPMDVEHAILLLMGHYYDNREAVMTVSSSEVPLAYSYLLQPYKSYDF